MATPTIFADRIVNISIAGGNVRIDLATIESLPQEKSDKLRMEVTQRLVMPLEGFVASMQVQEAVIKKLLQDGVLKAEPAAPKIEAQAAPTVQ